MCGVTSVQLGINTLYVLKMKCFYCIICCIFDRSDEKLWLLWWSDWADSDPQSSVDEVSDQELNTD